MHPKTDLFGTDIGSDTCKDPVGNELLMEQFELALKFGGGSVGLMETFTDKFSLLTSELKMLNLETETGPLSRRRRQFRLNRSP